MRGRFRHAKIKLELENIDERAGPQGGAGDS